MNPTNKKPANRSNSNKAKKRIATKSTTAADSIHNREIISIHQFSKIAMTFWLGGSWMVAAVIFPILFDTLDEITASDLVRQILHITAYIGIVCLMVALIEVIINHKFSLLKTKRFWYIIIMDILLMVNDFAIFPAVYRVRKQFATIAHQLISLQSNVFDFWHSFSAALFILTCVVGVLYLIEM